LKFFVSDPQNWNLLGARHELNGVSLWKIVDRIEGSTGHMAAVRAYCCCSALQYVKQAVGMKQTLSPNFFFGGIKQVVSLGHVSLAIRDITLEPPI
jgi:hypothetical protein